MKQRKCVLITGTIVPNSNFVTQASPQKRRDEYMQAIKFYSKQFSVPLYFLENSSYDIDADEELKQLLKQNEINLVKFPPSSEFEKGKGFQEFLMLDQTVERLKDNFDSFIKITGRQQIPNANKITSFPCPGMVIDQYRSLKVALTNFFYCTTEFYEKRVKNLYMEVNDKELHFIEKVLYAKLQNCKDVRLFPSSPKIIGVSGSTGHNLQGNKVKFAIRNIERKLLNSFGVNQFPYKY